MPLLEVKSVSRKNGDETVLDQVAFTQSKLQRIGIAGETGSGKTSLLKIIAGLINPAGGQVIFDGQRVKKVPEEQLIPGHPGIAYLSQQFELPLHLRVEQVLNYANTMSDRDAEALYAICRITPFMKRKTDELSGGEKQRIALARLLTGAPKLLLLDEPFSNLDRPNREILKSVIRDLGIALNITCQLVSHDPEDLLSWADELILLQKGRMIQSGAPEQVYRRPVSEYAGSLLGPCNLFSGRAARVLTGTGVQRTLFVRPEQLLVSSTPGPGLEAIIERISYFGHFVVLHLLALDQPFAAQSMPGIHEPGSSVWVSLEPGGLHWLD